MVIFYFVLISISPRKVKMILGFDEVGKRLIKCKEKKPKDIKLWIGNLMRNLKK